MATTLPSTARRQGQDTLLLARARHGRIQQEAVMDGTFEIARAGKIPDLLEAGSGA
jgi:hypothetical protein